MGSDDYGSRIFKPKNRMVRYLIQFGFLLAVALAMASLSFSSQSLQATMNQRVLEILSATPMSSYTSFSLEQSPANHRSMYTAGVAGEPEIVWLLSFPNSGTTYTVLNIQQVTNASTATNYATELATEVPVRSDLPNGPFLYEPSMAIGDAVVTKTHCAGYCDYCTSSLSVISSTDAFQDGCVTATKKNASDPLGGIDTEYSVYAPQRAIHLYRHPIDNIVARMHRGLMKRRKQGWTEEQLRAFNDTAEGIQAWCGYMDEKYGPVPSFYGREIRELATSVPCYSEFIRYVEWHNHANKMTAKLELPVFSLYYEDYANSYKQTVADLLAFVGLDAVAPPLPFEAGKTYEHLFSAKESRAASQLVRAVSDPSTWPYLRPYVVNNMVSAKTEETKAPVPQEVNESDAAIAENVVAAEANAAATVPERIGTQEPDIVWLMSFPNSGTSYTVTNTLFISNATTGTNYGFEAQRTSGALVPVRSELPNGPFLLYPDRPVPPLVLVKTHCTGYCDACPPLDTFKTVDTFENFCKETTMGEWPMLTKTVEKTYIPKKSVHILRSPFDNLVARKHLAIRKRVNNKIFESSPPVFEDSREGLHAFCNYIDGLFQRQGGAGKWLSFTQEAKDIMEAVPCYSDFFRYIQWHNNAVETTTRMKVPTHVMYYEDYTTRYDGVIKELNDFLELPRVNPPIPFVEGKTYLKFFTRTEIEAARTMFRFFATEQCWALVRHYFDIDDNAETHDESVVNGPDVVWLVSFPNSGTSYTMTNVMHQTSRTVGTNMGHETPYVPIPVRSDLKNGPFVLNPHLPLPDKYIMTKTHCSGFCDRCSKEDSIKSLRLFEAGCRTTKRLGDAGIPRESKYDWEVPKKAIHLLRNPFDNIVARMHLGIIERRADGWTESRLEAFEDTKEGVKAWCEHVDSDFGAAGDKDNDFFTGEAKELFKQVPCHSEWFRYVQWHNLAVESLTQHLNLTNMVLYYEDYTTKFNETTQSILDFLEAEAVQAPKEFIPGKTYTDLYDPEDARLIAKFIRALATPECWALLRRYFVDLVEADEEALAVK